MIKLEKLRYLLLDIAFRNSRKYQSRLEIVCTPKAYREFESLLLRQKEHHPTGWCSFCIQRFEQGMSEAKKRPSGAFSARLHRRGITIDATCPVPSIVPLPRKRLTFSATGSVSPLSVSRCGNTASESLLLRQIKPPSFDGGFIFYSALSANWAFLPLLPQHLSCGEDGVANALRAGTEDLAGLHAL